MVLDGDCDYDNEDDADGDTTFGFCLTGQQSHRTEGMILSVYVPGGVPEWHV